MQSSSLFFNQFSDAIKEKMIVYFCYINRFLDDSSHSAAYNTSPFKVDKKIKSRLLEVITHK